MYSWFLLILAFVCAYLSYDSWSLKAPPLPYSEVMKVFGADVSHLTLSELEEREKTHLLFRGGDLNGTPWIFAILTMVFLIAAVFAFL
jgi:hypothetical protein